MSEVKLLLHLATFEIFWSAAWEIKNAEALFCFCAERGSSIFTSFSKRELNDN